MTLDPRNILIVLHGSIGDVTRALPLANLIRRAYPRATLTWAIEPPAFPLVEHHPAVNHILLFNRSYWWKSLGPFLKEIRSKRFDLVLDLQRHLKSGLISWWSGAPFRLGFHRQDAKEFNWFFNNRHIPETGNGISKLSHYLKFAEFLGIERNPIEWGLRLLPHEEAGVERMLQDVGDSFAVFFVGARWESKRWFPGATAKAAAEMRRRYGLDVVLIGGKEDVDFAQEVEDYGSLRVANRVGSLFFLFSSCYTLTNIWTLSMKM